MSKEVARARTLQDIGRYQEAIAEYQKALVKSPEDSNLLCSQGWCYHSLKDYRKAKKSAQDSLANSPRYVNALHLLASSAYMLRQPKMAQDAINLALTADPNNAHTHYILAWKQVNDGKAKLALDSIETALSSNADNPTYLKLRSDILAQMGRRSEAKSAALEALRYEPEDADAMTQVGTIHRQEGNVRESINTLRQALRNDPSNADARLELQKAIRSRFILYRWMLALSEAIGRNIPQVIAPYGFVVINALRIVGTSRGMPAFIRIPTITLVCVIVFGFFAIIFMGVILDATASFDDELKLTLSRKDRTLSRVCLGCLVLAVISSGIVVFHPNVVIAILAITSWLVFVGLSVLYIASHKGN